MARPKKGESLIKTKDVHLRMSETEYEILSEKAIATNMSISDFIRNALNTQNVIIKYELTADVPEIKKLIGEFRKIGNNLNQIARHAHETGRVYPVDMEEVLAMQQTLWQGMNKLLTRLASLE